MTDASRICQRTPSAVANRMTYAGAGRTHGGVRIAWTGACGALALALTALTGLPVPAFAEDPPAADRIWHGCTLGTLAADLETLINQQGGDAGSSAINDRDDADVEVAFVVVYSLNNVHDGQPVGANGFTGPIICTAPEFSIEETSQTETISDANILDAEDAFILRYETNSGTGPINKRICHTVASNTDCFTVEGTGE